MEMGVHWVIQNLERKSDISCAELIDLRTLIPWDKDTIEESEENRKVSHYTSMKIYQTSGIGALRLQLYISGTLV